MPARHHARRLARLERVEAIRRWERMPLPPYEQRLIIMRVGEEPKDAVARLFSGGLMPMPPGRLRIFVQPVPADPADPRLAHPTIEHEELP